MFPRYNNASIEWHGRIPADLLMVDPKGKKLLELSKGEDATPEATDPMTDNQPPH